MEVEVRTRGEDAHQGRAGGPPRTLGRYRVVTELGRGSTSIVYLGAVDGPAGFNKLFALKLLRPALAADPALVAMFLAEARVGAHLSHPNVVSTLEIDETGPLPFIVMEYLDGQPLQRLVTTARVAFKPLPLHMHLAALSGALEGLAHAHAAAGPDGKSLQIVHRDFSPHNVFVTSSGVPKLLDFGCAQSVGAVSAMPISAGHAAYMSPEQAAGAAVDARSDLYAAGVMVWEAVTRKRFWSDEASKVEILRALAARELPETRVSALAHAPADLRELVLKATSPDPSDRYQSASALQKDVQSALRANTPPSFDLRDLGLRLVTVFAAERTRMQAIINAAQESAVEGGERSPSSQPRAPEPQAPVAPAPVAPAPVSSARPGPLPSFPMPADGRSGWPALHRAVLVVAAALVVIAGVAAMRLGADDRPRPSAPVPAAAASVLEAPGAIAPEEPARLAGPSVPTVTEPSAPTVTEPSAPTVTEPAPVASARRPPGPFVARTRGPVSPVIVHVEATPHSAPPDAKHAVVDEAIVVSGSNPTGTRPSHPIDSVNPYGP
jgi:eukaryotic-like serine/threonine-protein kinase